MNIDNKYVFSVLKKSLSLNLKTIIFLVPFIILISSFIYTVILPTYNHCLFVKNGNHNYVYLLDDNDYNKTGKPIEAIYYNRNITSHPDPSLDQSDNMKFYKYSPMVNLYICRNNIDVEKTMFSSNNMLKKVHCTSSNIWLSFELAKAMHVNIGDDIYMRFTYGMDVKDIPIKVSGISRSKYDDSNPTKTNNVIGNAMLFMDDATFKSILNETDEGGGKRVLFSDKSVGGFERYLSTTKDSQIEQADKFINENMIKALYVIVFGLVLICIVLSLDMSFTQKRHNKNMIILNMLGVPIHKIRKIFVKLTMINFTISTIIALLLVKYIFTQELLSIYVDLLPLIICFLLYMMVGIVSSLVQSLKIKKL